MNNKYKFLFLRLNEWISGFILSFIFLFVKKRKNVIVFNSINNMSFDNNSKYLFLYAISSRKFKNYDIYFVLNDENKRDELRAKYGNYFISNRGLANKVKILRAKTWFCSSLQTPVGGFFLSIGRLVYHLGHGMPYKAIVHLEKNRGFIKKIYHHVNGTNFSYYLATTDFYKNIIQLCLGCDDSKVMLAPQPRADAVKTLRSFSLSDEHKINFSKGRHILYAPTWRHYGDVSLFPFKDIRLDVIDGYLKDKDVTIWLRLHPFFSLDNIDISSFNSIKLFSGQEYEDINEYLHLFDSLITDYSSIFLDYLILERPVLFFDYDLDEYQQKIGLVPNSEIIKCGPSITDFKSFQHFIESDFSSDFSSDLKSKNLLVNYNLKNMSASEAFFELLGY